MEAQLQQLHKHRWQVVVGNVGTVFDGTNGWDALREYNLNVGLSKTSTTRMRDEPVTLMRDGEPYKEFDPDKGWFYVEVTDTFGGEANYCWVDRYKVKARTIHGVLRKVPRRGRGWRHDCDIPDEYSTTRFNAVGAAICCFVSRYDREVHGGYLHVETIE